MQCITVRKDEGYSCRLSDKPKPSPMPGYCLVQVHAAGINRRDYWISQGQYPGIEPGTILGSDACGTVVDGDEDWLGKRVVINPNVYWGNIEQVQSQDYSILGMPQDGTFAEFVQVPSHRLHIKPEHLNDEEAGALPLCGLTAFRALFTKGKVAIGDKVMITGVGGGVAHTLVLFAKAVGAVVYVTSGQQDKINRAVEMGAVGGFDYTQPGWYEGARQAAQYFDVVIDGAGGGNINDCIRVLKPGGRLVVYGATLGRPESLDIHRLFWSQISLLGSTMGSDAEFVEMLSFVERHQLKPHVSEVFDLKDGVKGIESMKSNAQYGKLVLKGC